MLQTYTTKAYNQVNLLFPLGDCYITQGINDLIHDHQLPLANYIFRHQTGDWSEMSAEDQEENLLALREGTRILSAFAFCPTPEFRVKIWVITETDRSTTTVLLPEEY